MWNQGTTIPINKLQETDVILVKFNCGLCTSVNEIEFYEFNADFFVRRPEYKWKDNLKCRLCEEANYHDIHIFYEKDFLHLDIKNERSDYMQTEVDPATIYYSVDINDLSDIAIEIPLEFDVIESIIGNDFYGNYKISIKEIKELISKPAISEEAILLKILYSNVISIFETFLFDLIINAVSSDRETLIKVVTEYKIFGNEKVFKSDIFHIYSNIRNNVIDELQKMMFHNLKVIIPLYQKTLSIDFADRVVGLSDAINVRHDIIHRNGKDFNNLHHIITIDKVLEVIEMTENIVDFVNQEYEVNRKNRIFLDF